MEEHPRIEIDPDIMVGKPVIRGSRITVELIVQRFVNGDTLADILDDYPYLTAEDVHAAVVYAVDAVTRHLRQRLRTDGDRAVAENRMTKQQLDELVAMARENTMLWTAFKHREEELEAHYRVNPLADPPEHQTRPTIVELVHSLVEEKYGREHHWVTGDVILAIRRELRVELGYPSYW